MTKPSPRMQLLMMLISSLVLFIRRKIAELFAVVRITEEEEKLAFSKKSRQYLSALIFCHERMKEREKLVQRKEHHVETMTVQYDPKKIFFVPKHYRLLLHHQLTHLGRRFFHKVENILY